MSWNWFELSHTKLSVCYMDLLPHVIINGHSSKCYEGNLPLHAAVSTFCSILVKMEWQISFDPPPLDPSPASSSLIFFALAGWRLLLSTHPAVAAQLVAVVEAFLLGQREALPSLVEVAQPCVDLVIIHAT